MTKILDLDKLDPSATRELVLNGKTYKVRDMTVQDFIETTETAKRLADVSEISIHMKETVRLIQRSIPDISEETLLNLSLAQLRAVAAFTRGEDPTPIEAGAPEVAESESGK